MADALVQLNANWRVADDPPQWTIEQRIGARIDDVFIYATCILSEALLRRKIPVDLLAGIYRDAADDIEEGPFVLSPKARNWKQ